MLLSIIYGLMVVIAIGILIFVHELGHFLMAKKVGIRVEAFSLGFGPKLFGFFRGGTDYKVCAIPLGGYVKMAGEYPGETTDQPVGDEFFAKSVGQRAWVVSAGVIMNVIFAFFAFPLAFSVGVPFTESLIGNVSPASAAWESGMRRGDEILSIDGTESLRFDDLRYAAAFSGSPLELDIRRDAAKLHLSVQPKYSEERGAYVIGVGPALRVRLADEDLAREFDIGEGDEIVTIAGVPAEDLSLVGKVALQTAPDAPVVIRVKRTDGTIVEKTVKAPPAEPEDGTPPGLGLLRCFKRVTALRPVYDLPHAPDLGARAGLMNGDVLVSVNGAPVNGPVDLWRAIDEIHGAGALEIVLDRPAPDGGVQRTTVTATMAEDDDGARFMESFTLEANDLAVRPVPGGPAAASGIQPGDTLVSLNDEHVDASDAGWAALVERVRDSDGSDLHLTIRSPQGALRNLTLRARPLRQNGVFAQLVYEDRKRDIQLPFPRSVVEGSRQAVNEVKNVLLTLRSLVMGDLSARNMGGIITIARASYGFARQSLGKIIFFMGILSLNLAILNILPIPVLDGGHLVFLILEKVKGGPLSERAMSWANIFGLVLILGLMVYVTFNDIVRLIG